MTEKEGMVLYDRTAGAVEIPDANNLRALATDLLNSKLYPNFSSATQVIAVIAAGQELGLGPTASLQYISIVNGRMCAEAKVWLALFHKSGGKTKILKRDRESCRIEFSKPGHDSYISEYTQEMAKTEQLWDKANWKKMPETYLQWRAVSNGIRAYDPGVVMGLAMTAEEAEDYPAGVPGAAIEAELVKEPKKGRGRPRAAQPTPEPSEAPESSAEATPGPAAAPKPAPQPPPEVKKPAQTGFELPAGEDDEDDPLAQRETAEGSNEGEETITAIKKGLADQGVDGRSFKEWLIVYQDKMTPKRKFLVRMQKALRFHGGNPEDHKYLLAVLDPAIAMFRYSSQPETPEEK